MGRRTFLRYSKAIVYHPFLSLFLPIFFLLVIHVIYVDFVHEGGHGMEDAFPHVDFHTRWDVTWQQPDHPAVLDWLNFETAMEKEDEETAWHWETLQDYYHGGLDDADDGRHYGRKR